ncbi:MAG: anaerobic ribonucleoside-triphosphate reductase activating protein [Akkermansia muciniphila]|nr:anaerobic ribonucleoside-triphosphate reductase activating protein [Akkermansia muciniphila]MCI7699220.1 anaerobic ribonucleoside-triphosphate reductase activating protein [Akkermansia sp.]
MLHPQDITPLTFLDYPGKAACIFWYTRCNLRCPYCYNPDLVLGHGGRENEFAFLEERRDFLDAVVLSGGECTLNPDIEELCERIHALGYLIKVDTNGSNPQVLERLLERRLVDYVALDNKMPSARTWKLPSGEKLFDTFCRCVVLLQASGIRYEVRTTVHPALLDEADILCMIREAKALGYTGTYGLQFFFNSGHTLGNLEPPTRRYDRRLLDKHSPLRIEYRNFPEDRFKY